MGNNHKKRSLIPKNAAQLAKNNNFLNKNVALLNSWEAEGNKATVFVSLRFVQHNFQCFSEWNRIEMKEFWNFQENLSKYSWEKIYEQGGKKNKTGFAYTEMPISKYPNSDLFSPDITLFELRANDKIRLHGFRDKAIFYICWLDRNHEISD